MNDCPIQVDMDLSDPDGVFAVKPAGNTQVVIPMAARYSDGKISYIIKIIIVKGNNLY